MTSTATILLRQLHEQSNAEVITRARSQFRGSHEEFLMLADEYDTLAPRLRGRFLETLGLSTEDFETTEGTALSLAVSAETGRFLHNMALAHKPHRILELGSSYGVSTLYFAEALRTLGGGVVVATELDALKCAHLRNHVSAANVDDYVDLREGDVFQTVAALNGSFDMVFMDVWANTYLDLFKRIEHLLRPGSIVFADNMYTAEAHVQPYKAYLDSHPRYSTTTLDFESGVEFTVAIS